ncbi:MAG: hypothetical protein PSV22_04410 [Pseudolabrys sp.]|nr:hypothetical protein [Pseudolabrys sp.]
MAEPWKYNVTLKHADTGETREVQIKCPALVQADAVRHFEMRGPEGPGGGKGPIANAGVMQEAHRIAGPGFVPLLESIRLIEHH